MLPFFKKISHPMKFFLSILFSSHLQDHCYQYYFPQAQRDDPYHRSLRFRNTYIIIIIIIIIITLNSKPYNNKNTSNNTVLNSLNGLFRIKFITLDNKIN